MERGEERHQLKSELFIKSGVYILFGSVTGVKTCEYRIYTAG